MRHDSVFQKPHFTPKYNRQEFSAEIHRTAMIVSHIANDVAHALNHVNRQRERRGEPGTDLDAFSDYVQVFNSFCETYKALEGKQEFTHMDFVNIELAAERFHREVKRLIRDFILPSDNLSIGLGYE